MRATSACQDTRCCYGACQSIMRALPALDICRRWASFVRVWAVRVSAQDRASLATTEGHTHPLPAMRAKSKSGRTTVQIGGFPLTAGGSTYCTAPNCRLGWLRPNVDGAQYWRALVHYGPLPIVVGNVSPDRLGAGMRLSFPMAQRERQGLSAGFWLRRLSWNGSGALQ